MSKWNNTINDVYDNSKNKSKTDKSTNQQRLGLKQAMAEQGPTRVPSPTMCKISSIYLISV